MNAHEMQHSFLVDLTRMEQSDYVLWFSMKEIMETYTVERLIEKMQSYGCSTSIIVLEQSV